MSLAHPAYGVLRPVTRHASVLLADNPSAMTLDGTNTWVLRGSDTGGTVVVDPGPDDDAHARAVAGCGPVRLILVTHRHPDHTGAARALAALTGAPVRAVDPEHRYDGESEPGGGLGDGDLIEAAGIRLRVLATPGHTTDSVCLVLVGGDDGGPEGVLTGDTILGRGTTVVAHPDGRLGEYLATLRRLRDLGPVPVLPGHGPELTDLGAVAEAYLRHRAERLDQVRAALTGGDDSPEAVTARVYADVDRSLWPAAQMSVRAQLDYLRETDG